MIKRDGVQIMNARTNNVTIAKETLEVLKNKRYHFLTGEVDLSEALDEAVKGTVLYKAFPLPRREFRTHSPTLEVTNETTTQAAVRLAAEGKNNIVALNFASAHTPGGGFLGGAIAQEEDLCRASGLYDCLRNKPLFYNANILCDNAFYTDNILYSPRVPFFRDDRNRFLQQPYLLSIITSPAPCLRGMEKVNEIRLSSVIRNRTENILQVAEAHGHKNLILGAWGCGAYGNDPQMMACHFFNALQEVPAFDHICFAVYDNREPPVVYETFKQVLGD